MRMFGFNPDKESYGSSSALAQFEQVPAGSASTLVYFSCDDCANEESIDELAGGKVQRN